jgi:hypothetical protein
MVAHLPRGGERIYVAQPRASRPETKAAGSRGAAVIEFAPMHLAVFFFGYFWFSHRTGGGEVQA